MEGDVMDLEVLSFEKTCRICLKEEAEMQQLFVRDHSQNIDLLPSIMLAWSAEILVDLDDGLPCQICKLCMSKLYTAYFFRKQCQNSDSVLRQYVQRINRTGDNLQSSAIESDLKEEISAGNNSDIIDFNTVFNSTIQTIKIESSNTDNPNNKKNIRNGIRNREPSKGSQSDKCVQTELVENDDGDLQTLAELKIQLKSQNINQVSCSECGKTYTRLGCHKRHILEAHGINLDEDSIRIETQCQICKYSFTSYTYLKKHMISIHKRRKVYLCSICNIGFNKYSNFKKHSKICNNISYNCDHCKEPFINQKLVNEHIQSQHPETMKCLFKKNVEDDKTRIVKSEVVAVENMSQVEDDLTNDTMEHISQVKEEPLEEFLDRAERETSELVDDCGDSLSVAFLDDDFSQDNDDDIENEIVSNCQQSFLENKVKRKVGRPPKYPLGQSDISSLDDVKYHCDECPKVFRSQLGLKIHKAKHFGEQVGFECTLCGKMFTKLTALKRHKLTHDDIEHYQCDMCDRDFSSSHFLEKHMAWHFKDKAYQCDECPKSFGNATKLQSHKAANHSDKAKNPKIAFCAICNRGFTTKQYLSTHIRMHNGDRTYTCDICEKSFNSKWHLREHTKWHSTEKQFLCSECGQRFIRNDYLVIHMRRHKGEKPYKCKFCNKGFPRATDLTVHERYHTGEKTHLCMVCGKGFQRQYNLTVHLRVHTGERPYPCSYCNKRFAQSNDLKSHVRRHTGERSSCDLCGEGFIQGYHLTQHKRSVHGIECNSHIRRVEKHASDDPDSNGKIKSKGKNKNKFIMEHMELMENPLPSDDVISLPHPSADVMGEFNNPCLPSKVLKMDLPTISDPIDSGLVDIPSMKALVPQVFSNQQRLMTVGKADVALDSFQ